MKSPAKGVVKPMVSGHTITKPTITLQRLNMQGYDGNFLDLSIIDEGSPRSSNSSPNTSGSRTVSIANANRLGLVRNEFLFHKKKSFQYHERLIITGRRTQT